jgi:hypothetical protein
MTLSKGPEVEEAISSPSVTPPDIGSIQFDSRARDEALDFLEKHRDESNVALGFDPVYVAKVKRKIDWRFIPFGFCAITFNIIDKVLLNVSDPHSCS